MKLPLVYSGHDYLPHVLTKWLADDERHVLIVLDGERVVALDSVTTLDGGCTVISQALRVDPEYQGRGISKLLQEAIDGVIAGRAAKRFRVSTYPENVASLALHLRRGFVQLPDVFCGPHGAAGPVLERLERFRALAGDVAVTVLPVGEIPQELPKASFLLSDWIMFDASAVGVASFNAKSMSPLAFATSTRADGSLVVSHCQLAPGATELYFSIYYAEHFWAHFVAHLLVAQSDPSVVYFGTHIHASCRDKLAEQAELVSEAFVRDEFNSGFSGAVVLEKSLE